MNVNTLKTLPSECESVVLTSSFREVTFFTFFVMTIVGPFNSQVILFTLLLNLANHSVLKGSQLSFHKLSSVIRSELKLWI